MSSPSQSELPGDGDMDWWDNSDLWKNCEKLEDVQPDDFLLKFSSDEEVEEPAEVFLSSIPAGIQCTPGKENHDSLISSPRFCTPYASEAARPFASCSESPIDLFAASTPFQGQRILSNSSAYRDVQKKFGTPIEGKAEKLSVIVNETFNLSVAAGDGIYNEGNKNLTFCKDGNATFDTEAVDKDSGSDIMDSCTKLESSGESRDGKPKRKPLTAIPQPKTATAQTGAKKVSRLAAPRMNTAAISRIQARSLGNTSSQQDSEMMKPPKKIIGSTLRARKSLLPPSYITKASSVRKPNHDGCTEMVPEPLKPRQEGSCSSPAKRKAQESPKRVGHSPKVPGTKTTALQRPANRKSNSAPSSRIASATVRTNRPQRPSALKAPSSTRLPTVTAANKLPDKSSSTTSSRSRTRNGGNTGVQSSDVPQKSNTVAMMALTANGNLRKPRPQEKKTKENNVECITGLAILLYYVVNKLDGLSAPRLSDEKQQLQKLLDDKKEANVSLSTRLSNLEHVSKEADERHARELEEERKCRETVIAQLEQEREKCRTQITSLQLQQEEMRAGHESELAEMKASLESDVAEMKASHESDVALLHETMENRIHEELKERIKPYVDAVSEVESLTAVLDIKNNTIHKLEAQSSNFNAQRDEILALQYKVERLQQKNEDLSMQLKEKAEEHRSVVLEYEKLRRAMNEERSRATKLCQQNEELVYRLNTVSPTMSSSFNPVFTTSPTVSDSPAFDPMCSTPVHTRVRRVAVAKSSFSKTDGQTNDILPRSLSYNNNTENNLNSSL